MITIISKQPHPGPLFLLAFPKRRIDSSSIFKATTIIATNFYFLAKHKCLIFLFTIELEKNSSSLSKLLNKSTRKNNPSKHNSKDCYSCVRCFLISFLKTLLYKSHLYKDDSEVLLETKHPPIQRNSSSHP